jgi:hypothetical protein
MDVALMRQNLGNVFFQQLARGHEQLPNRAFGRRGLVALYSGLETHHQSCDMLAWSTKHNNFKSFIGVYCGSESALAARESFGEFCGWLEQDFGVCY